MLCGSVVDPVELRELEPETPIIPLAGTRWGGGPVPSWEGVDPPLGRECRSNVDRSPSRHRGPCSSRRPPDAALFRTTHPSTSSSANTSPSAFVDMRPPRPGHSSAMRG